MHNELLSSLDRMFEPMPCHLPDRRGPNDDAEGRGHRLQRSAAQQGRPGGQRGRGPRRLTAAAAPPGP